MNSGDNTQPTSTDDERIEWLSFADFIRFIYAVPVFDQRFEDLERETVDVFWDIFLGERTWPDPSTRQERDDFIRIFGEETGKRILMWELSSEGFDLENFTAEQASDMLTSLELSMAIFNHHEDLGRKKSLSFAVKGGNFDGNFLVGRSEHKQKLDRLNGSSSG